MKIVVASESHFPSSAANTVQTVRMCSALSQLGHEVWLIGRRSDSGVDFWSFYGQPVEQFRLRLKHDPKKLRGRKTLFAVQALLLTIRTSADLFYTRSAKVASLLCKFRVPTVLEVHRIASSADSSERRQLTAVVSRNALKRLVVVSEALKDYAVDELGCPREKILVSPNGADDYRAAEPERGPVKSGRWTAGYVGSLHQGKGAELVVALGHKLREVEFLIVGGPDGRAKQLRAEASENTRVVAEVAPAQVASVVRSLHAVLVPPKREVRVHGGSLIDQKNAPPLKLFSALSSGVPILCSNYLSGVVVHEEHALLCDPDDANEWVSAITRLRSDQQLAAKLSSSARSLFEKKYAWSNRASTIMDSLT